MSLEIPLLIIQCLLSLLTSYMAIFQLKKEFRKKTTVARKEANQTTNQLILIAFITLFVQILAYFNSQNSQQDLREQNSSLKLKIENSQLKITNKIDSTEGAIALQASKNALKASQEIKASTIWLSNYVNGSNKPPRFASIRSSKIPRFVLENNDSLKADIDAFCVNYDDFLLCKRKGGRVDRDCFYSHFLAIPWTYILPKKQVPFEFPHYNSEKPKSKFYISISLSRSTYIIEVILLNLGSDITLVSSRTLLKVKGKYIVYSTDKSPIKIDWDKEFILPYDEKFGDL